MDPKDYQDKYIAPMMREQELQRREIRNTIIRNHAELQKDLTEVEKDYVRTLHPDKRGYWKRLWHALINHK